MVLPVVGEVGLVGRGDGGRIGAFGRAWECEEGRREVGPEVEAEAEGWFMAAREELGMSPPALLAIGGWTAWSCSEDVVVREAQQP